MGRLHALTVQKYTTVQHSPATEDNKPTGANIAGKHKLISSLLKERVYIVAVMERKKIQTEWQRRKDQDL